MNIPRVMIAGVSSGSGKTTAVCALLTLLLRRGVRVGALKCGPDYIDPMFHRAAMSVPCANLDPFFCDEDLLRYLLSENAGRDLTLIEGVMGYYDGTGESGTDNSSWTVAKATRTPVVLLADARGSGASLLATVSGFLDFVPDSLIAGVVFSRCTPSTYMMLKKLISARFGERVLPLGFIPKLPEECLFGSRHLGLVTAEEIPDIKAKLDQIADLCEGTLDIDGIIKLAGTAPELSFTSPEIPALPPVRIAYTRDPAFCFYYHDTLRLFEKMGAELIPFSPLKNEPVPEGADGLLLGGGYPELYADALSENTVSRESVRGAVSSGLPTIAECGGFQYLGKTLEGKPMCGVLPFDSFNTKKLVRFGYISLTAEKGGLLGPAGVCLRGHEFHYYDSTENGDSFTARKPSGRSWSCVFHTDTLYAGYPHLYLCSAINAAKSFYSKCLERRRGKEQK